MLDLSYLTESSGVIEKFELSFLGFDILKKVLFHSFLLTTDLFERISNPTLADFAQEVQ